MVKATDHVLFLKQCHRRWAVWRIAECAGIGAVIGSAVGFLILPVLLWRAQATIEPAGIVLGIGVMSGAVFGLTRRPTLIQTALEADRQLKLNDLLSTAITGTRSMDDGFAALVQLQAAQVCRNHSPNELIIRRLGGRAWGGIGIASSLLLTLAMMTTQPVTIQARTDQLDGHDSVSKTPAPSNQNSPMNQAAHLADQSKQRERDNSLDERDGDTSARSGNAGASRSPGRGNGDGMGAAAGRTNDASISRLTQNSEKAANDENGELVAQGNGSAVRGGSGNNSTFAAGGSASPQSPSAQPWQSSTWSADRAEAIKEIQSGKTPDAYRDIVREYFDPQPR